MCHAYPGVQGRHTGDCPSNEIYFICSHTHAISLRSLEGSLCRSAGVSPLVVCPPQPGSCNSGGARYGLALEVVSILFGWRRCTGPALTFSWLGTVVETGGQQSLFPRVVAGGSRRVGWRLLSEAAFSPAMR